MVYKNPNIDFQIALNIVIVPIKFAVPHVV